MAPSARSCRQRSRPFDARQQDVEDDQVVVVDADLLERVVAVGRDVHGVGVLAQPFGEHRGGDRLVFDDQYSHCG